MNQKKKKKIVVESSHASNTTSTLANNREQVSRAKRICPTSSSQPQHQQRERNTLVVTGVAQHTDLVQLGTGLGLLQPQLAEIRACVGQGPGLALEFGRLTTRGRDPH